MTLLRATGLSKRFGKGDSSFWAVKDVALDIEAGEKVAITGPSGCGKTTLINMLGLVIPPTEGILSVDGHLLKNLDENKRASFRNQLFGYIVQDYALVEDNTVFDNIEIPLIYARPKKSRAIRRKCVMDVIEQVGLDKKVKEKVKNLSGGQRQRVAIARAIVNNPRIILADEPTGSLDVASGLEIMAIIDGLVSQGKSLFIVTHNIEIASLCNRRIHMIDGKIQN
jgi:putative ABC transport system ATP-binding protein